MPWHVKNTGAYARTSQEALENAQEVYNVLYGLGWCLESVCAALGNIEHESGYNPWRWQGDVVLPVGDPRIGTIGGGNTAHAYGLCQQDPAAKYIYRTYAQSLPYYGPNYSDRQGNQKDGQPQLQYIHWICSDPAGGEWDSDTSHSIYNMPFADFIVNRNNQTILYLTRTFFYGYERGTWSQTRVTAANYWLNELGGYTPVPPEEGGAAWFGVLHALKKKKQQGIYYRKRHKGWWY